MSGPIIRKYGFPNHESIFGKKEIEHGVEAQADEKKDQAKPESRPKSEQKPVAKPNG